MKSPTKKTAAKPVAKPAAKVEPVADAPAPAKTESPAPRLERTPQPVGFSAADIDRIFGDLLAYRMLDQGKASVRKVEIVEGLRVYEFTSGERITVDPEHVAGLKSADAINAYVSEVVAARKRP